MTMIDGNSTLEAIEQQVIRLQKAFDKSEKWHNYSDMAVLQAKIDELEITYAAIQEAIRAAEEVPKNGKDTEEIQSGKA